MQRIKYFVIATIYIHFLGCHTFTEQPIDEKIQHFGIDLHITASVEWQKNCSQNTVIFSENSKNKPNKVLINFLAIEQYTAKIKTASPYEKPIAFCDFNQNGEYNNSELIATTITDYSSKDSIRITLSPNNTAAELTADSVSSTNLYPITSATWTTAFSPEKVRLGLWQPAQFDQENLSGVYLPETQEFNKEITLLIHGINSSPAIFKKISTYLENKQQSIGYFYYASGHPLEHNSRMLYSALQALQKKHTKIHLVAHSMGGLVTRNALNYCKLPSQCKKITTLTTISTPWLGHNAAATGVKYAPNIVPVWYDMAPQSDYLNRLLLTPLPNPIKHTLVFGFRQKDMLGFQTNDGTVSIESMLAPIAQKHAVKVIGLNEDHTSILSSDALPPLLPF